MSTSIENNSSYVILVNEDNTMTITQKRRIMQRSKLVDDMCFLVNPLYNNIDISDFTVVMEYVLPISRSYRNEVLVQSTDMHNGYLKYTLPFDTELTAEHGNIEVQLSFIKVELDNSGNSRQLVRKTSPVAVSIVPITAWSDIIPDSALTALDQRIIKTDAQIKAINDMNDMMQASKADNIKYDAENNALQLLAGDKEIGDRVVISHTNKDYEDGIPAVDINEAIMEDDTQQEFASNVVEF